MSFKKIIGTVLLSISSMGFALTNKGQVDLIPPTGIDIKCGVSSWSQKLTQCIQVNPIQILFWNTGNRCNIIPITSVSVKYANDLYWYNAIPKDGYYEVESKYAIEAVKLDFYLDSPVNEFCIVKVTGFRDIAEPKFQEE
jgi:hypothetical protein